MRRSRSPGRRKLNRSTSYSPSELIRSLQAQGQSLTVLARLAHVERSTLWRIRCEITKRPSWDTMAPLVFLTLDEIQK
jgi:hypothetical protein